VKRNQQNLRLFQATPVLYKMKYQSSHGGHTVKCPRQPISIGIRRHVHQINLYVAL